jgi:hypothetical protein
MLERKRKREKMNGRDQMVVIKFGNVSVKYLMN